MTAMQALERLNKAVSRGCSPTGFNALNSVYFMLKQREIDEAWRQYRKSDCQAGKGRYDYAGIC